MRRTIANFRKPTKTKKNLKKSRECHYLKPEPTPDTKRKGKKTESNACKVNKQMQEKHIDRPALSLPSEVITMLNRTAKHDNKGKTQYKTPRSKNHKATQNK